MAASSPRDPPVIGAGLYHTPLRKTERPAHHPVKRVPGLFSIPLRRAAKG
jgi:hypothetical protein